MTDAERHLREGELRALVGEASGRLDRFPGVVPQEGVPGTALAGLLQETPKLQGRKAAVILCGGNIDRDKFLTVLGGGTPSP